MTFKIYNDVPVPTSAPTAKYEFHLLTVGQMMFIPAGDDPDLTKKRVQSAASAQGKKLQRKFTTAEMMDKGVQGVGVWRVE